MGLPHALITDRGVFFDGWELPWYITQDGISYNPGGDDDFDTLTIEFFVESATFQLSWEKKHDHRWGDLRTVVGFDYAYQHRQIGRVLRSFLDVRG